MPEFLTAGREEVTGFSVYFKESVLVSSGDHTNIMDSTGVCFYDSGGQKTKVKVTMGWCGRARIQL